MITPIVSNFLYKNRMWKKSAGKVAYDGSEAVVFNKIHKANEISIPRLGGVIIWLSAFIAISFLWILSYFFPQTAYGQFDLINRGQTWIPLVVLVIGGLVGAFDDILEIRHSTGGLSLKKRLALVALLGLAVGWWFYTKLDVVTVNVGDIQVYLGPLIILFVVILFAATYAGGIIDGIDGLAGGIFTIIFASYAAIAYTQDQYVLAAFCGALVGGTLSFLWFNIPPARFYMSETGSMPLTLCLVVVALLTDSIAGTEGSGVLALPFIAFLLYITVASVIIQLLTKKFFGRKVFHSAPLHHHFEALEWPRYKVTMRYWILGAACAITGIIVALSF
jgi:phospho-N-acetylmuramoyl-pentapeptide-transferase